MSIKCVAWRKSGRVKNPPCFSQRSCEAVRVFNLTKFSQQGTDWISGKCTVKVPSTRSCVGRFGDKVFRVFWVIKFQFGCHNRRWIIVAPKSRVKSPMGFCTSTWPWKMRHPSHPRSVVEHGWKGQGLFRCKSMKLSQLCHEIWDGKPCWSRLPPILARILLLVSYWKWSI